MLPMLEVVNWQGQVILGHTKRLPIEIIRTKGHYSFTKEKISHYITHIKDIPTHFTVSITIFPVTLLLKHYKKLSNAI